MSGPAGFSIQELSLAAQSALESGRALLEDCLALEKTGLSLFPLACPGGSLLEMSGFFGFRKSDPKVSLMGCFQRARFVPVPATSRGQRSIQDAGRVYRDSCRWVRPDGSPGGFTYTPLLQKRIGIERPEPVASADWDFDLSGLEWLVVRVDIHDFVRAVRPLRAFASSLSKRVKEAALLLVHRDFSRTGFPRESAIVAEHSFGYSFLPLAPEASPFGFGPGHFGSAFKRFRFLLRADGALDIELMFVVSPRSEKVLDLKGIDPVYASVHFLDLLTLRKLRIRSRVHDRFDKVMLKIHGQVHYELLEAMRPCWERTRWVASP